MNPSSAISVVFVLALVVSCLLIAAGRPSWLATRIRQKPFYPWCAWNWTEMPANWQHHRIWASVWGLLFGCVAVGMVVRCSPPARGMVVVPVLMCVHFLWLVIRITLKNRSLSRRD